MGERIREVSERLNELGPPLPEEQNDKLQLAWTMVIEFCANFKNSIAGKAILHRGRKEVTRM
jgi:hypothetical protein